MDRLILYMTEACHLCEQAQLLVIEVTGRPAREIDIVDDDSLMTRYGVRIPVLRTADGRELGWPFDAAALRAFLDADVSGADE